MKCPLARGALALTALMTLASCGGGKETFPITVTVGNVKYDGLVLSTNGQDVAVHPATDTAQPVTDTVPPVTVTFPNQIEYGQTYDVLPKVLTAATTTTAAVIAYPKHQTCAVSTTYPYNLPTSGTAGQLAKIQIYYVCSINTYQLTGTVKGLKATGQTCTVSGGANGNGTGTMDDAAEAANGVTNLLVQCVDNPA